MRHRKYLERRQDPQKTLQIIPLCKEGCRRSAQVLIPDSGDG